MTSEIKILQDIWLKQKIQKGDKVIISLNVTRGSDYAESCFSGSIAFKGKVGTVVCFDMGPKPIAVEVEFDGDIRRWISFNWVQKV